MGSRFVHNLLTLCKSCISKVEAGSVRGSLGLRLLHRPKYLDAVTIKVRLKVKKSKHSHSTINILTLL